LKEQWDQAKAGGEQAGGASALLFDGVDLALTDNFFGAVATFLLGLEQGHRPLNEKALARLRERLGICAEINLLPQWWAHRVALHLLSDLWDTSFHERLRLLPADGDARPPPDQRAPTPMATPSRAVSGLVLNALGVIPYGKLAANPADFAEFQAPAPLPGLVGSEATDDKSIYCPIGDSLGELLRH
jgi:hypothetical protein